MGKCDQKCVCCHFFMTNTSYGNKVSAKENFREAINQNDLDLIVKLIKSESYSQAICYKGIWSWKSYLTTDGVINSNTITELTKDRNESCFFFHYSEGMTMKTAEELLIRETQNKQAIPFEVKVTQPVEVEVIEPVKVEVPQKRDLKFIITTINSLIMLVIAVLALRDQIKTNSQKNQSSVSSPLNSTPSSSKVPIKIKNTPKK